MARPAHEFSDAGTRMPVLFVLGRIVWRDTAHEWAVEFDAIVKSLILSGDHDAIMRYEELGAAARLAISTNEHFLPLLYVLALQEPNARAQPTAFERWRAARRVTRRRVAP